VKEGKKGLGSHIEREQVYMVSERGGQGRDYGTRCAGKFVTNGRVQVQATEIPLFVAPAPWTQQCAWQNHEEGMATSSHRMHQESNV